MARKKTKRIPRKRRSVKGPIFVSPDGGHTVYEQLSNGDRILVQEDDHAKMMRHIDEDSEMWGEDAYELRKKYPALQTAYNQYKTVYKLVSDQEHYPD
jgi:hypothetical protein